MPDLLPAIAIPQLRRLRDALHCLGAQPPQTLLFEGGTETQRLQLGQYWAMTVNCPTALASRETGQTPSPCLECPSCRQIAACDFADMQIFDGRITNAQDEDNPGPIRSLRMDNIRELKIAMGASPNGNGKRVVLLQGMSPTREEAMNSLLKVLEEPSNSTIFVLLTSQRSQILPTLVSRSMVLTLPWTDCLSNMASGDELLGELAFFLRSGTGFLDKISSRGVLDMDLAGNLLLECQKALARIVGKKEKNLPIDQALRPLGNDPDGLLLAHAWCNEAHGMLQATVNPQRVMEAFSCRLFELLRMRSPERS